MNIMIREATIQDGQAIHKLNTEEMGYDYGFEKTLKRLQYFLKDMNHKIFVAEIEGEVVGYVHGNSYELLYYDSLKNIMGIAVLQKYKKNGVGKLLLQQVEIWAKSTGAVGVRLNSGESRTDAHLFYQACGYHNKKNQKNFN